MRRALQIVMVISVAVSVAALCGFLWFWAGYGVSEAFNSLLPHPADLAEKAQFRLWGIYLVVSLAATIQLFLTYRRTYRRK
jgi:hypothetical protein